MRTLAILILLLGGCVTPAPEAPSTPAASCPKGEIYFNGHCVLHFRTAREAF